MVTKIRGSLASIEDHSEGGSVREMVYIASYRTFEFINRYLNRSIDQGRDVPIYVYGECDMRLLYVLLYCGRNIIDRPSDDALVLLPHPLCIHSRTVSIEKRQCCSLICLIEKKIHLNWLVGKLDWVSGKWLKSAVVAD